VGAVVEGQQGGSVTASIDAAEIHRLVVALSTTWGPASLTCTADRSEEEALHEQQSHPGRDRTAALRALIPAGARRRPELGEAMNCRAG
jgi:hypothetical protein